MRQKSKQDQIVLSYLRGVIIPEERGKAKCCVICFRDFGMLNKEHQCKRCKRPVCDKCSPHKAVTLKYTVDPQKPHRQCSVCKDESDQMQKFIKDHQLEFNKDTLSSEWLHAFQFSLEDSKKDYKQAQQELDLTEDQSEYNMFKGQQQNLFQEMEEAMNYSIREFFTQVLTGNQRAVMFKVIEEILEVFLKKFPNVGYQPDLTMITLFLLCFSSASSAYTLLTIIYSHVIPPYIYSRAMRLSHYDFNHEIESVHQINKLIKKQFLPFFLQSRLSRYIQNLTVNLLSFETTFLIWNIVLSSQEQCYERLIKCIALAVNLNDDELTKIGNKNNKNENIEIYLLRNARSIKVSSQLVLARNINIENPGQAQKYSGQQIATRQNLLSQEKEDNALKLERILRDEIDTLQRANDLLSQSQIQYKKQIEFLQVTEQRLTLEVSNAQKQNEKVKEELNKSQEQNVNLKYRMTQYENVDHTLVDRESYTKSEYLKLKNQFKSMELLLAQSQVQNQSTSEKAEMTAFTQIKLQEEIETISKINQKYQEQLHNIQKSLDEKNLELQKLQQQQELTNLTTKNENEDGDYSKYNQILVMKNEQITQLTEQCQKYQSQADEQLRVLEETEAKRKYLDSEVIALNEQLLKLRGKLQEQEDFIRASTNLNKEYDQKLNQIKTLITDIQDMKNILEYKTKEIEEMQTKLNDQVAETEVRNETIRELQKQISFQKDDIEINKYVISKFGRVDSTADKELEMDIQFLAKDQDQVKKRIISTLKDTLVQQQRDGRFRQLELQVKKDQINELTEKILKLELSFQSLEVKLQQSEQELEERDLEQAELLKELKKREISPKRRPKTTQAMTINSQMKSTTSTSSTDNIVEDKQQLDKEIYEENKQGCTQGSCKMF